MKVLFVSSGNLKAGISPIIKNQGESLMKEGVKLEYYAIKGKGLYGYIKNIKLLRNYIKENDFDIIHAHYSLSAIIATLAGAKPLVVSLMGSDVKAKKWFKVILWIFYKYFWAKTIVKSLDMKSSLRFSNVDVIPNGVNLERFILMDKLQCQNELGWDNLKTNILFAANPNRPEKNFQLADKVVNSISDQEICLHTLVDIPSELMPVYLNAADIVLLTSLWEGSPNVVKEAMACSRIIVSTNVGDIEYLLGDLEGAFVCKNNNIDDITKKLEKALEYIDTYPRSNGRISLINKKLDSVNIAKKIITNYIKLYKIVKN